MTAQNWSSLGKHHCESQVQVGPQTGGHKHAYMQLQYLFQIIVGFNPSLNHKRDQKSDSHLLFLYIFKTNSGENLLRYQLLYFLWLFSQFSWPPCFQEEISWWSLFGAERVKTCVQLEFLLRERITSPENSQVREKKQWFKKLADAAVFRRQQGWTCSRGAPKKHDLTLSKPNDMNYKRGIRS